MTSAEKSKLIKARLIKAPLTDEVKLSGATFVAKTAVR